MQFYKLDKLKRPRPCSMRTYATSVISDEARRVAFTAKDGVEVSTVFLGIDQNFTGKGKPILFETMVFGGEHNRDRRRARTWKEAEQMHKEVCELIWPTSKD